MRYRLWSTALLAGALLPGCLAQQPKQQSIESLEGARMTHNQLRNQVLQFMGFSARLISEAGQQIAEASGGRDVRYNSLVWRIYAVSEFQSAGMRPNPVIGLTEIWIVSAQMRHLFEREDVEDFFGEHQSIALEAARRIEERAVSLVASAVSEDVVEDGVTSVENYVNSFPIEDLYFARWREPGEHYMRFLDTAATGALASVATLEDRVTHLTTALPEMVKVSADLARWEAELAVQDLLGRRTVGELFEDFEAISQLARDADELATKEREAATQDLVEAVDAQRIALTEAINAETASMTALIEEQRRAIEALVTAERIAALEAVDTQRTETLTALREERQIVLDAVDDTVAQALETVPERIEEGIDAFWLRAVQIGGAALVVVGLAGFFALRHLVDRARRPGAAA